MCSGISMYKEGLRFWKNLLAFRGMEVPFQIFYYYPITGAIARYTEDFAIKRFAISRFHCKIIALHFTSLSADSSQTFFNFTNRDNRVKGSFLGLLSEVYTVTCMSSDG